jgi:hypothetical protein
MTAAAFFWPVPVASVSVRPSLTATYFFFLSALRSVASAPRPSFSVMVVEPAFTWRATEPSRLRPSFAVPLTSAASFDVTVKTSFFFFSARCLDDFSPAAKTVGPPDPPPAAGV